VIFLSNACIPVFSSQLTIGLDNLTDQEFKKQAEANMLYC